MTIWSAPRFWWREPGLAAAALAPLAHLYALAADRPLRRGPAARVPVPVLCVGNFTVGGAGKTPAALALAQAARALGRTPGFLSRGHGGEGGGGEPILVDGRNHDARYVGDEPLLLAAQAPTVVARDRAAGAERLRAAGCDFVLMDDGFQSARLHPDLALLVVDGRRGIGNGRVVPAGPLRASLALQMRRAGAVLVVGDGAAGAHVARIAAETVHHVFRARSVTPNADTVRGLRCLAFSGIADGEKFAVSLRAAGAEIVSETRFPDHHAFSQAEARSLLQEADSLGVALVTTVKDRARLTGTVEGPLRALRERSLVLEHRLEIEEEGARRIVELTIGCWR